IRTSAGLRIPGHTAVLGCNESVISISSNREPKDTVIGKMKSKGSQGKRAQAPIPSNNVLSVSEVSFFTMVDFLVYSSIYLGIQRRLTISMKVSNLKKAIVYVPCTFYVVIKLSSYEFQS
ncbi:unnamed protein product, partial [Linum tenue]